MILTVVRFAHLRHDPDDVQYLCPEEAALQFLEHHRKHFHFGPCRPIFGEDNAEVVTEQAVSAAVGAGVPAPPASSGTKGYLLLEFCCSDDSVLCNERYAGPHVELIRLTEAVDMTSTKGLRFALDQIERTQKHVVLFGALPCTWGSGFQRLNQVHLANNATYQETMRKHFERFKALIRNFRALARVVAERRGDIIFEWPTGNLLWKQYAVQKLVKRHSLEQVNFHGCMLGVQTPEGVPIKKPWTFRTTVPQIVASFGTKRCSAQEGHQHANLEGKAKQLEQTAFYPPAFADLVHQCLKARVDELHGLPLESSPSADVFLPALLETAGEGSAYDESAPLHAGPRLLWPLQGAHLTGSV